MTERTHTRRCALTATAAAGAVLGTGGLAACANGQPSGPEHPRFAKGTHLANLGEVPVGSATSVRTPDGQAAIVSRPTADEVAAFSAVCTHQGCTVRAQKSELHCPCHDSTFDPFTGEVRAGPAREPLPAIDVTVEDDRIVTR